jgi:hypothetical protein
MVSLLAAVLFIGAMAYIIWKAWTGNGLDWRKGIGAFAALIAGALIIVADWLNTFAQ